MSVFEKDLEECTNEVRGDEPIAPLTDDDLAEFYELEKAAAECLGSLGYEIEVPTLQVFIDRFRGDNPFLAHAELGFLSQPDYERATQECPPPGWTPR